MMKNIFSFDDRRDIIVPGSHVDTITYCTKHFIDIANHAIQSFGACSVALSGGSTPKTIFQQLASPTYRKHIDWSKMLIFWSDERCVPPDHPDSNYRMAMDAGFATLPIPKQNIFRMPADSDDIEQAAISYEKLMAKYVPSGSLDLIMLGMGEDGHTASLFPRTHGLHAEGRIAIANFIPQKDTWRMSMTFDCINAAHHIAIYVLGKSKAQMVKHVLTSPYDPDNFPIQNIGTRSHKALWILDADAAIDLKLTNHL